MSSIRVEKMCDDLKELFGEKKSVHIMAYFLNINSWDKNKTLIQLENLIQEKRIKQRKEKLKKINEK